LQSQRGQIAALGQWWRETEHQGAGWHDLMDPIGTQIPERLRPERIILPVRDGFRPNPNPPVRIFVGTEASQFRPERVLVWSIEQVRDPSRVYEIHIMKELAGFDRSAWTTGFTNYRFAIPAFADGGRAIYNDEDQIYLTDPAELFDLEMAEKGFLAISDTESSVMLIDCDRMSGVWSLDTVRTGRKKALLSSAVEAGLLGELDPHWNARDGEYVAGRSHLLHYTTLHTQPWQPFPERFVYRDNPLGYLWHDLERAADKAQFSLFDRERPSSRFGAALEGARIASNGNYPELDEIIGQVQASSVHRWDPSTRPARRCADAVVCSGGLDAIPEDDVPWVLDEVFAAAERFVYAAVDCAVHAPLGPKETETETSADRWGDHFRAAGERHPEIHWELLVRRRDGATRATDNWCSSGPRFSPELPRVWVVVDPQPEHREAADALCAALGWPTENIALDAGDLAPPWPDLLIASGTKTASTVEKVRRMSLGRTRVVAMNARVGATDVDLLVTPVSDGLFPHPKRFAIATPLVMEDPLARTRAAEQWREMFARAPRPHIAILAGGAGAKSRVSSRASEELGRWAGAKIAEGGSLFALIGRPHDVDMLPILREATRVLPLCRGDESYLAHLESADEFIVTGNSEAILADTCKTGKPVRILPMDQGGWLERLRAAVARLADSAPLNNRGTVRPQQGLERLCSRLISRGFVRPPRDYPAAQDELIRRGAATEIGSGKTTCKALDESVRVADEVRSLLGVR
jgi:mitochondrial fission protein ELM1